MATGKNKKSINTTERKEASAGHTTERDRADVAESYITSEENEAYITMPYLIFKVQDFLYAINIKIVQQITWLPELTPIAESAEYIAGVFNYHDKIVSVIDLDLRLGYTPRHYRTTDKLLVLKHENTFMGVIVNEVLDVREIFEEEFESSTPYRHVKESYSHFLSGMAKIEGKIVMVIDYVNLMQHSEEIEALIADEISEALKSQNEDETSAEIHITEHHSFCPEATTEEREIFRRRAIDLMQSTEEQDMKGLIPMAIVDLNGEYYGVELEVVREFSEIHNITPIPCCPDYVIGNTNMRGEIITLVDIRNILNMSIPRSVSGGKVIVVQIDDILAGVTVDNVYDIIFLHQNDITAVPASIQSTNEEYLKGTAHYRDKIVSILNFKNIFTKKGFAIDEEV